MRKRVLLFCGFVALGATVALAAIFGMAGTGKAASVNTCMNVNGQPNCFTVKAPLYLTSGQTGVATATFKNIFGNATASHTVLTLTFPAGISVLTENISASRPGTNCSASGQTATCDFGSVQSGTTVRMFVRFTGPTGLGPITVTGSLSYAEGNGTNGNDVFNASSSFQSVDGTGKGGYCTTAPIKFVKNKMVPLLTTTDAATGQTTTIEQLSALTGGFPCTNISAGIEPAPTPGPGVPTSKISVVDFLTTGAVTLLFPGRDASTFVLKELSIIDGQTWVNVAQCGNPVDPSSFPAGTDSCYTAKTNVTKNGTKFVQISLTVVGSPPDGRYGG
jgi:hypothetical protein